MADSEISVVELRRNLSETLSRVAYQDQEVVITRNGKPVAALVPPGRLDQLREEALRDSEPPYSLSPEARRALDALSPTARERVSARIEALARDPYPPDHRELRTGDLRVAVGEFRIVYAWRGGELRVEHLGTREDVYRELGVRR